MSPVAPTPQFDRDTLRQLPTEQLVNIIMQQQQEIERLKASLQLDSKTSSKPPSTDLIKKPEKQKESSDQTQYCSDRL